MARARLSAVVEVGVLALVVMLGMAACSSAQAQNTAKTTTSAPSPTSVTTPTPTIAPRAQACQQTQLAGQFRAGSPATGNTTGEILVRNTSTSACAMLGNVDFYGVDAQGNRIAGSGMNGHVTLAPSILPPNTPTEPAGVEPTPGDYLVMFLLGAYRDDPAAPNGLCSAANEVTPAQLALSVGNITVRVTNYDAAGGHFPSMMGCHGMILGEGASLS